MLEGMSIDKYLTEYYSTVHHVQHVSKLSLMFFECINKDFDELPNGFKKLLAVAALLHDIGYSVSAKSHNKHSFDIIMQNGIYGYNENETELIAHIARYHRGSFPDKSKHKQYSELNKKDRKIVKKLSAILRLCDGLTNAYNEQIDSISTEFDSDNKIYTVILTSDNKLKGEIDINSAIRKKDLFEKVFHVQIIFKWA